MINVMRALINILFILVTLCNGSAETPVVEFGSIDSINRSAGKEIMTINEAFGPKGVKMKNTTKVVAVEIGKFVGGNSNKKFAGYIAKGDPCDVNRKNADVVLSEKHVGLFGSGKFSPQFALIFGNTSEENIVLLVSPPRPMEDIKFWSLMEAESGMSAPVDEVAGKFLAEILAALKKPISQSK